MIPSETVPYVGVPDQLLFEEDFYATLSEVLTNFPKTTTVRFIVSSVFKQINHCTGAMRFDNDRYNVCVCDVEILESVRGDHAAQMQHLTDKLFQSLSPNIHYH